MENSQAPSETPLPVIAHVSRVVTAVVDRIAGDRVDVPLLVGAACVKALSYFGIESRVMYGQVAWIEVMEDHSLIWAGCWGENYHFWVATQYGEIVDLNTSVAYRKRSHSSPNLKAIYSPPMLWSKEVPSFYRYVPEGIAELELTDQGDAKKYNLVLAEIEEKCRSTNIDLTNPGAELDFPNEPILCPGRRLLDDSRDTFRHFDRALSVHGIPEAPI
jgi:hypothetical protein